ncbi:DUF6266 family protein [Daejeonella lutea]|uniref:Uncharacterized protein n=1 Tax=Daejeonella lutea TaxID=572036 RepID=A0A1T5DY09_9SPHI|nr:DUF6266 family protein [Daejeonella lutea]SKB76587.1 hypothetical protein SAMN05661099_2730 [Daejeonella lutea]
MGKYKRGILGAFSGKIGTVVGSSWKGIDYMRSLPKPSTKAPSEQQMMQRAKFALVTGFFRPASALINLGYQSLAQGKSGYNVATADFIADAIIGTYPNFDIDYTKVLFSKGTLTGAYGVAIDSETGAVKVTWDDNTNSGTAKATDRIVILVYNTAKGQFVYDLNTGAERSAGEDALAMPAEFIGDTVQVWLAFMTPDKKTFSTSIHAGQIVVA